MNVSEAVAHAVAAECPGTPVFALIGDANLPFAGSLQRDAGVRQVMARHEGAAVAMADGYAQASGGLGLATITAGPGLTHAATSLLASSRMRTPMVVVAGDTPQQRPSGLHALQAFDQRRFAEATEALFVGLRSAASLDDDVRGAFYLARTRRRPVVLDLPVDLQAEAVAAGWHYEPSAGYLPADTPPPPASEDVRAVAALLAGARRPLIVAGRGARGARAALERLARATGALLGTTLPGKGLFDADAWCLGVVGGYSRPAAEALIREADLVVAFGAELGHFTTQAGSLLRGRTVVRVDTRPAEGALPLGPLVALQADAGRAAEVLLEAIGEGDGDPRWRTQATRARLRQAEAPADPPSDGRLDPRALMRELGPALPSDALVVIGGGHFTSFPCLFLDRPADGELLFPFGAAAIGQAVPFGIGVGLARPDRPVVVIEGDGSLLMNVQELETAHRLGARLLVLVMNDAALSAERLKLTVDGYDPELVCYPSPDFPAIAAGFGWRATRLERPGGLAAAVDDFQRRRTPILVDAHISREVVINPVGLHDLSAVAA